MLRLVLLALAACELVPAPKQQPPPVVPLETAPASDAAAYVPSAPIAQTCEEIGKHVAAVMIAVARDQAERSILEQERETTARKAAENCMAQKWSKEKLACYVGTRTPAEIKACDQQFPSS